MRNGVNRYRCPLFSMGHDEVAALAARMDERYGDGAAGIADRFAQTESGDDAEFLRRVADEIRAMKLRK